VQELTACGLQKLDSEWKATSDYSPFRQQAMTGRSTIVHTLFILQMKHSIESEGDIRLVSVIHIKRAIFMHWL
jgi:hypothetical protein